eukprot:6180996-Pleurochrysis_carterae.AAC.2
MASQGILRLFQLLPHAEHHIFSCTLRRCSLFALSLLGVQPVVVRASFYRAVSSSVPESPKALPNGCARLCNNYLECCSRVHPWNLVTKNVQLSFCTGKFNCRYEQTKQRGLSELRRMMAQQRASE